MSRLCSHLGLSQRLDCRLKAGDLQSRDGSRPAQAACQQGNALGHIIEGLVSLPRQWGCSTAKWQCPKGPAHSGMPRCRCSRPQTPADGAGHPGPWLSGPLEGTEAPPPPVQAGLSADTRGVYGLCMFQRPVRQAALAVGDLWELGASVIEACIPQMQPPHSQLTVRSAGSQCCCAAEGMAAAECDSMHALP